jgi:hypothetical protein
MAALAAALRRITGRARSVALGLGLVALAAGATTTALLLSSHGAPAAPPPASGSTTFARSNTASPATVASIPPAPPPTTARLVTAPQTTTTSPPSPTTASPTTASPTTASPTAAPTTKTAKRVARHPDAVREVTRELGYGAVQLSGADPDGDARDARAQADAARTELDRGRRLYVVAAAERRRGDCDAAVAAAKRAITVLVSATSGRMMPEASRTDGLQYIPRARLVMGLCALEAGRVDEARTILKAPMALYLSGVEGAERQLAIGVADAELGDIAEAVRRFHDILNSGDAVARALGPRLQAYARAVGLSDATRD